MLFLLTACLRHGASSTAVPTKLVGWVHLVGLTGVPGPVLSLGQIGKPSDIDQLQLHEASVPLLVYACQLPRQGTPTGV